MESAAYSLLGNVEANHWFFVGRRRVVRGVLKALHLPRPARLLEFGSGTGGNLAMLSDFGKVTAFEPEPTAREMARQKAPGCTHATSLTTLPVGEFDAILALDVLEHLDDPAASLRDLLRHLRRGGKVIVTVPAHPLLFGRHDAFSQHRRRYTQRLLIEHLRAAGLSVEALSPMNAISLAPAIVAQGADKIRTLGGGLPPSPRGMDIPPEPINRLLTAILGAESLLLPRWRLPFGLSLLAVASQESMSTTQRAH